MPGAQWFPGATVNYAGHALRDGGGSLVVIARSQTRAGDVRLTRRRARRAGRARGGGPEAARRPARRSRRRVPAECPRGARPPACDGGDRRSLLLLPARVRRPRGDGPLRPDRAEAARRRRRVPLPRRRSTAPPTSPRSARRCDSRGDCRPALPLRGVDPVRFPARFPGRTSSRRSSRSASSRFRSATRSTSLLLRHDRPSQADRSRSRRHPARARQGARAAPRPRPRRPFLLVLHDRLDDVELPRLGPPRRLARRALRRRSALSGPDVLWRLAEELGVTYFGASAPFLLACSGRVSPRARLDSRSSAGSVRPGPAPARSFRVGVRAVGRDVLLGSAVAAPTSARRSSGRAARAGLGGRDFLPLSRREGRELRPRRAVGRRASSASSSSPSPCRRCPSASGTTRTGGVPGGLLRAVPRASGGTATGSRSPTRGAASSPAVRRDAEPGRRPDRHERVLLSCRSDRRRRGQSRRAPRGRRRRPGELLLFVALDEGCARRRAAKPDAKALRKGLSPRHVPDEIHAVPWIPGR